MTTTVKKIDKTLDAENITLLRDMLEMELARLKEKANLDLLMFMGVDGRTFSSIIPNDLTPGQYYLLNLAKVNIPYICSQLRTENLTVSIQQFKEGTMIISGVGSSAFILSMIAGSIDINSIQPIIAPILMSSQVIKHVFELKPNTEEILSQYPDDVAEELKKLSRLLFKESFSKTREYKKSMRLYEYIKQKVSSVVGVGSTDEVMTLAFNEMGTAPAFMKSRDWKVLMGRIINDHIRRLNGDIIADECLNTWIPELEEKLKTFV